MMLHHSISSIFCFSLLSFTHAAEFQNSGTLEGWSRKFTENLGTVEEVTDVFLRGPSALKMTQTYQASYKGRYHSEVIYPEGYRRGQTKFYGFAFQLSDNWGFDGDQSFNIVQWIADFRDTKCDDASPTSMVYLRGNTLFGRIKTGQLLPGEPCPPKGNKGDCNNGQNNCQKTREFTLKTGIKPGQWYSLVLHVGWKSDSTGFLEAWVGGTKVHEEYNTATTLLDDKRPFEFRIGLYANGWHDEHTLRGQPHRTLYVDEVTIGSSFEEVDPQKSGPPQKSGSKSTKPTAHPTP